MTITPKQCIEKVKKKFYKSMLSLGIIFILILSFVFSCMYCIVSHSHPVHSVSIIYATNYVTVVEVKSNYFEEFTLCNQDLNNAKATILKLEEANKENLHNLQRLNQQNLLLAQLLEKEKLRIQKIEEIMELQKISIANCDQMNQFYSTNLFVLQQKWNSLLEVKKRYKFLSKKGIEFKSAIGGNKGFLMKDGIWQTVGVYN